MPTIGVVLTTHSRPQNLIPQVQAVRSQSVEATKIVVWHNRSEVPPNMSALNDVDVVYADPNRGVWPRFYFA